MNGFASKLFVGVVLTIGATFTVGSVTVTARPWREIEQSTVLRVAVKADLPPLAWQDESIEWQGFEIAIGRQLAGLLLGDEGAIEFVPVTNQERLEAVIEDRVDLAIAQIGITLNRIRTVNFTLPYYLDGTTVVVPDRSPLSSPLQLSAEAIAVLEGSSAVATLNTLSPQIETVGADSYQELLEALQQGKVDGVAADASVMAGWVANNPNYKLLTPVLSGSGLAVALPKGNQYSELRRRVHDAMKSLSDSGWFERQARAWGLP